jgi:hypothetical protein
MRILSALLCLFIASCAGKYGAVVNPPKPPKIKIELRTDSGRFKLTHVGGQVTLGVFMIGDLPPGDYAYVIYANGEDIGYTSKFSDVPRYKSYLMEVTYDFYYRGLDDSQNQNSAENSTFESGFDLNKQSNLSIYFKLYDIKMKRYIATSNGVRIMISCTQCTG